MGSKTLNATGNGQSEEKADSNNFGAHKKGASIFDIGEGAVR
ncbi:hypothetical protein COLO4_34227 [Corchorus olitorius]|uniref:Uncharacterized protein n=1 Tax=Corchorus olitorius TaxID=93759 RepID=A0A1R3GMY2_9ROSI|nr:hypothetical protein COLO4_34227 [Corchorus olitorius]